MTIYQPQAKPHYIALDALRGVAAITVVCFHIMEAHAANHVAQVINHGYLAVDFFFLLSGFVVGYAYDDRWQKLTIGGFFKRRLIRLQPMVVMGMLVGAAFFYFQTGPLFPGIAGVPVWKTLAVMLIGCTLLPLPKKYDIRGWQEMHPLDGPAWSLFFEYIANILYALWVRKFSKTALTICVILTGIVLILYTVTAKTGDITGGWTLDDEGLKIGFIRLLYPFFTGLLLSRVTSPKPVNNTFLICSVLLVLVLAMPRVGGYEHFWANGLYESISIIVVFPLIVYWGARGRIEGKLANGISKFLGDISYPLYITHYALIYTYTAWVVKYKLQFSQAWPWAAVMLVGSVALAYACLKWYDEPVRRWLQKRFA